jgi:hypothetical protein
MHTTAQLILNISYKKKKLRGFGPLANYPKIKNNILHESNSFL